MSFYKYTSRLISGALGASLLFSSAYAQEAPNPSDPPLWSMADKYWGAAAMAKSREAVLAANGAQHNYMLMGERLEYQTADGDDAFIWDVQGWYGGDINKLYIKTEGEYVFDDDEVEDAEIQALWSRAVSPFWDVQTGIRYDLSPKGQTHAVIGIQGLAPYWLEIDAAAFLSADGDVTARIEAEYEILFTQRLILQPRAEIEFSAQAVPALNLGTGVTGLDAGLRLRYEIKSELAPYIGLEWQKSFGETANFSRTNGEDTDKIALVLGIRTWF